MSQASDHSGISDGPENQFQPARPGSRPRRVVIILFFEGNLKASVADGVESVSESECVWVCFCVSICVLENLYVHFLNFVCSCTCNREGPSRLQVQRAEVQGRLVDELFFAEGYDGKDKHWGLLRLLSLIPLEVTHYDCSRRRPDLDLSRQQASQVATGHLRRL